ncbi:diguanylate cyclase [Pseudomonas sp. CDFA 602]|uniref:sensor domain-containing diguanylate cyclase n=1 Tax=Pseudomonas californiensis TaxID=2829823 RepID=UPI001E2F7F9B|nr:sensor domain-containing diguanylate cyclase [Pseudomonas californiensis]MCD5995630.1 diguanylate cyclase [Pseudomonas californiensis]MCD6001224.1 diguanylate cyclase [Pseudomonas californiensis]
MSNAIEINELHWLLAVTQNIDVGIVVLDLNYRVSVWNTFMENRSGVVPYNAIDKTFFELFPDVNQAWFSKKIDNVVTLGTPAFTIWEQRPYLVRFKSYQPITGQEEFMYQNTTLFPLRSTTGEVSHVCLVIYDVTDVATNRHQLQAANAELQQISSIDRLTGLYNRGHWEDALKIEFARHTRYGSNAALVMLDIDHFKTVNDSHGHQVGDKVLRSIAALVHSRVRTVDVAGRYGGEEFAVLLPDTDKAGALLFAERLRKAVEESEFLHESHSIRCTISLGVADLSTPTTDYTSLIEWADQAMYAAKRKGRNQVCAHE